ncbi:hypothetical protein [Rhodococcoides yunnanense]|uniref:hypothetical protein n=1 Tax=Rhodococcoides yunnanense TaxID=278209 RepID=UPI000934D482|nr:hypothetical protein [Rhodococcus yunnanensis]
MYVNDGPEGSHSFTDETRTKAATATKPNLIIVQGQHERRWSTWHRRGSRSDVRRAAGAGTAGADRGGRADLRAEGRPDRTDRARDDVRGAAERAGVTFIDPLSEGWLSDPDPVHLGRYPSEPRGPSCR